MRRPTARLSAAIAAALIVIAAVAVGLLAVTRHRAKSGVGAPATAAALYNSVGIDTHLTFANTSYGEWPRLVALLGQLGVRHLADGAYANPAPSWAGFNRLFDTNVRLAVAHGLRFAYELGKPGYGGGTIAQLVATMSGPLRDSIEAVFEPNEFDTSGYPDWQTALAIYDRALYQAVAADGRLRTQPVIGPSLVGNDAPQQLGDQQAYREAGALPPYTGSTAPSPAYIDAQLLRIRAVSGFKPVWATELGYSDALDAPAGQQPVSEYVGAVYLLRELLEDFQAGVRRSYVYELIDDQPDPADTDIQDHYGLLTSSYTPKPAFTALRNLLALVGDTTPSRRTPLPVTITPRSPDIQSIVVQRSDHDYELVLWRLDSIWNSSARTAIPLAPQTVTLTAKTADAAGIADPLVNPRFLVAQLGTAGTLRVTLGADPVVVRLTTKS